MQGGVYQTAEGYCMLSWSQAEPTELICAPITGRSPVVPSFSGASCLAMGTISELCCRQHRPNTDLISITTLSLAVPMLRTLKARGWLTSIALNWLKNRLIMLVNSALAAILGAANPRFQEIWSTFHLSRLFYLPLSLVWGWLSVKRPSR